MSQALYRKWRPARFDDVVGQEHVTSTLRNSVVADRVGHAYLFCGPRGTGKTTSARLLAKAVNCLHEDVGERPCNECAACQAISQNRFLDLIEIDAASNTGVDDIRDLRDKINFAPSEGRYKVYIIDEVHMLSTAAFNALLKTLEEPPPHAKFVLATTEEHKVPMTIKSRCQQYNFRLLSTQEIVARLNWLVEQEGLRVEPAVLALVARHGAGSLRDAESLLDQLVGGPGELITVQKAQQVLGTATSTAVATLADALMRGDGATGLEIIHEALSTGVDARQFCRQMVVHLRQLLLLKTAGMKVGLDIPNEQKAVLWEQAQRAARPTIMEATKLFNEASTVSTTNWQPQLPLELAFIESLPAEPVAQTPVVAMPSVPSPTVTAARPTPVPTQPTEPARQPQVQAKQKEEVIAAVSTPAVTPSAEQQGSVAAPTAGRGQFALNDVKGQVWREMVAKCGEKNRNLKSWLTSSRPLAVEPPNTLVIGFDFPFLKPKVEAELKTVTAVFSQVLGRAGLIKCVMASEYTPIETNMGVMPSVREEISQLADELGGVVRDV